MLFKTLNPDYYRHTDESKENLRQKRHRVKRRRHCQNMKTYGYVLFYFKECSDYITKEKELIKLLNPKLNIKCR